MALSLTLFRRMKELRGKEEKEGGKEREKERKLHFFNKK